MAILSQEIPDWDLGRTGVELYRDHLERSGLSEAPGLTSTGLLEAGVAGNRVGSMSQGQQRRLHLALCLARRPELLILDEPSKLRVTGPTPNHDHYLKVFIFSPGKPEPGLTTATPARPRGPKPP